MYIFSVYDMWASGTQVTSLFSDGIQGIGPIEKAPLSLVHRQDNRKTLPRANGKPLLGANNKILFNGMKLLSLKIWSPNIKSLLRV
jgi:hypothetical protein